MPRVQEASETTLPDRPDVYMVRVQAMWSDTGGTEAAHGGQRMAVPDGESPAVAPVEIRVLFWMDREPDIESSPLPPWLSAAVLARASELMYDMAEVDWQETNEEEEEEEEE